MNFDGIFLGGAGIKRGGRGGHKLLDGYCTIKIKIVDGPSQSQWEVPVGEIGSMAAGFAAWLFNGECSDSVHTDVKRDDLLR